MTPQARPRFVRSWASRMPTWADAGEPWKWSVSLKFFGESHGENVEWENIIYWINWVIPEIQPEPRTVRGFFVCF